MDFNNVLPPSRKALTKEQKAAFVLLMFLGIGGVLLGFLSFGANVKRPFQIQLARYTGETFLTPSQQEAEELEQSKSRDTDADGLSDYDESYVFKTSAYLSDTDSDGFDDKMEVFSGNDPNCPTGTDCGRIIASQDAAADSQTDPLAVFGPTGSPISPESLAVLQLNSEEEIMAFLEALSVDEIRASLINFGVDKNVVDTIDDETLHAYFKEAVTQAEESGQLEDLADVAQQQEESDETNQEEITTP